jgi:hypothetical protein
MGYEIDIKGTEGTDGEHGRTFIEKANEGKGLDGGNAGFSTSGMNAGEAYLRVSRIQNEPNSIVISGIIV